MVLMQFITNMMLLIPFFVLGKKYNTYLLHTIHYSLIENTNKKRFMLLQKINSFFFQFSSLQRDSKASTA